MRTVQVSLDVFQAIWTQRKPNEQTEDIILRRLLKLPQVKTATPAANGKSAVPSDLKVMDDGFHDPRYNVKVPSGFEIFRTYKGKEYRAKATQGFWVYGDKGYPTLNELNTAIGIAHENAWKAWLFKDAKGRDRPFSDLRDPSTITKRRRPTIDDLL